MADIGDRTAQPKPVRGSALLAARERRAGRVAHEQKEMQAALKRDGRQCRFPACEFKSKELPIDPAHFVAHRKMGGDPKGVRTQRNLIVSLCRMHHGQLDAGLIDIQAVSDDGADGCLAFFRKHPETGEMEHVATERAVGVSETRGA